MSAPLSNRQKAYLAQLARDAWKHQRDQAAREGRVYADTAEEHRRKAVRDAVAKEGLRCCDQDDYGFIKGHLLQQLGKDGAAFEANLHQATNGRRVAEAKLVTECERAGLRLSYADSICQRQYRCSLFDASEKQLWTLIFTIRNRAASIRRKQRQLQEAA